ncbi:MAG: hypothetical protein ACI39R_08780 [Lachnospiraceae bacterium]
MKTKRKLMALTLCLSVLLCISVAIAAELHSQSKQYKVKENYYVYGYVSITEATVFRPYNSVARISGSGATDQTLYVYNGLGESNYTSLTKGSAGIPTDKDCIAITMEKRYEKSGTTVKKYNNMKITSSDVTGDPFLYVKISAGY